MKLKQLVTACIASGLLAGCALPQLPNSTGKTVAMPTQWQQERSASISQTSDWWLQYHDTQLNQLMSDMLAANTDLKKAGFTLRTAWLEAGLKAEDETPTFSASLNSESSRGLKTDTVSHSQSATLSASYSLDLWNKLKHTTSAAEWEAKATEEDLQDTALTLTNTAAKLYWQIGYLNDRLAAQQAVVQRYEKLLSISQAKYQAGAVSRLDVSEAESALAMAKSSLLSLNQQQRTAANSLSVLLGKAPTDRREAFRWSLPADAGAAIPVGIPADVLSNRPDLVAANQRLESALESSQAARAAFFPELTLTGSLGSSSTQLKQVLNNPIGTLGVGVTLPFLQWGELKKNYAITEVSFQNVVNTYRATVFAALSEVDNALTARSRYQSDQSNLERSVMAATQTNRIQKTRYQQGLIEMSSWLSAENSLQTSQDSLLENRYQQLSAEADLWLALGGKVSIRQ